MSQPNEALIEAIKKYQNNSMVHPLTCGKDSRHEVLKPEERDGKVVLVCPTCDYVQDWIPGIF